MKIDFTTSIKTYNSDVLNTSDELVSFLRASDIPDNSFNITKVKKFSESIKPGDTISPIDIFSDFSITASDVGFVFIQFLNNDRECFYLNDMVFNLSLGSTVIGDFSLFTLANISSFSSSIVINSVSVPVNSNYPNKEGVLSIYVGLK